MSAFLANIHYWLYNKIQLHEKLIETIVELAERKGFDSDGLIDRSISLYGKPVAGSLEEQIEHSNIHGWLQERISSVERRLAHVVTELLNKKILSADDISGIFHKNAVETMEGLNIKAGSPGDYYTLIFDHMLEGMPCDRVSQIIRNLEGEIAWQTTRCLHKDYWDEVGGDVNNFYQFRDAWIEGVLAASGSDYIYRRTADGLNTIEGE